MSFSVTNTRLNIRLQLPTYLELRLYHWYRVVFKLGQRRTLTYATTNHHNHNLSSNQNPPTLDNNSYYAVERTLHGVVYDGKVGVIITAYFLEERQKRKRTHKGFGRFWKRIVSSYSVQDYLLIDGSKWLCHLRFDIRIPFSTLFSRPMEVSILFIQFFSDDGPSFISVLVD